MCSKIRVKLYLLSHVTYVLILCENLRNLWDFFQTFYLIFPGS